MTERALVTPAEQFATATVTFFHAVESGNLITQSTLLTHMKCRLEAGDEVNPDDLERLARYLLTQSLSASSMAFMMEALQHPDMPTDVLDTAVMGANEYYRTYALQNPNCSDYAAVYGTLKNGGDDVDLLKVHGLSLLASGKYIVKEWNKG